MCARVIWSGVRRLGAWMSARTAGVIPLLEGGGLDPQAVGDLVGGQPRLRVVLAALGDPLVDAPARQPKVELALEVGDVGALHVVLDEAERAPVLRRATRATRPSRPPARRCRRAARPAGGRTPRRWRPAGPGARRVPAAPRSPPARSPAGRRRRRSRGWSGSARARPGPRRVSARRRRSSAARASSAATTSPSRTSSSSRAASSLSVLSLAVMALSPRRRPRPERRAGRRGRRRRSRAPRRRRGPRPRRSGPRSATGSSSGRGVLSRGPRPLVGAVPAWSSGKVDDVAVRVGLALLPVLPALEPEGGLAEGDRRPGDEDRLQRALVDVDARQVAGGEDGDAAREGREDQRGEEGHETAGRDGHAPLEAPAPPRDTRLAAGSVQAWPRTSTCPSPAGAAAAPCASRSTRRCRARSTATARAASTAPARRRPPRRVRRDRCGSSAARSTCARWLPEGGLAKDFCGDCGSAVFSSRPRDGAVIGRAPGRLRRRPGRPARARASSSPTRRRGSRSPTTGSRASRSGRRAEPAPSSARPRARGIG